METEKGKLYTAGIYSTIAKRVQQHFGRDVLDATKMAGILKAGETRRGVAVFRDVDGTSDVLTVYVSGLSGDLKVDKSADGKVSVLYRTYKVMYARAGDEFDLALDPVTLKSTEWVWRP